MFNKKFYRGLALIMAAVIVVGFAVPVHRAIANSGIDTPRYFIALGDSISSGFGLPGYNPRASYGFLEDRHTSVLFEKLEYEGIVDEYLNLAISGLDTAGLIRQLSRMDEETLNKFQNARIVAVNIGGNNLLTPFLDYLDGLMLGESIDELLIGVQRLIGALQVFGNMFSGSEDEDNSRIVVLLPGFLRAYFGLRALFGGGAGVYAGLLELVSVMMGDLPPELMDVLEEGAKAFEEDFHEVLSWLHEHAPNATIIVNTVYNPIPREIAGLHAPIADLASQLIGEMNEAIIKNGEAYSLVVVDLYLHLTNRVYLSQLNLDFGSDDFSVDIIHPSAEGHHLIAELQHYYFHELFTKPYQNGIMGQVLTGRGSHVYAY